MKFTEVVKNNKNTFPSFIPPSLFLKGDFNYVDSLIVAECWGLVLMQSEAESHAFFLPITGQGQGQVNGSANGKAG